MSSVDTSHIHLADYTASMGERQKEREHQRKREHQLENIRWDVAPRESSKRGSDEKDCAYLKKYWISTMQIGAEVSFCGIHFKICFGSLYSLLAGFLFLFFINTYNIYVKNLYL